MGRKTGSWERNNHNHGVGEVWEVEVFRLVFSVKTLRTQSRFGSRRCWAKGDGGGERGRRPPTNHLKNCKIIEWTLLGDGEAKRFRKDALQRGLQGEEDSETEGPLRTSGTKEMSKSWSVGAKRTRGRHRGKSLINQPSVTMGLNQNEKRKVVGEKGRQWGELGQRTPRTVTWGNKRTMLLWRKKSSQQASAETRDMRWGGKPT